MAIRTEDGRLWVWPMLVLTGLVFVLLGVLAIRLSRAVKRAVARGRGAPRSEPSAVLDW